MSQEVVKQELLKHPIIEFLKHRRLQVESCTKKDCYHLWVLQSFDSPTSCTLMFEFPLSFNVRKHTAVQLLTKTDWRHLNRGVGVSSLIFIVHVISPYAEISLMQDKIDLPNPKRQVIKYHDLILGVSNIEIPTYHILSDEEKKEIESSKLSWRLTTDIMTIYFGWPVGTVTHAIETDDFRIVVVPSPELSSKVKRR